MQIFAMLAVLLISYVIGSIPSGLLIVKLLTGRDIRSVESGRTGGTNVMRAAGFWAGLFTAILDILKSAACVWFAQIWFRGIVWLEILAPVMAIIGHNYSIFLLERTEAGRLRLRGGAGGAPCVGGSFGLWAPSILFIVPMAAFILYFIGYASVTTLSVAFLSTLIFAYRAWIGLSPWQYAIYGLIAEIVLIWALRPNIRRLLSGNERLIGLRAKRKYTNQ
ncbi:MAG TPA: glycerol-3-phosphate acyltransferase [Anaerolineales bacterium]|nr:glycerol-3-phosphate acyltransferase [Anaerolineales bacterium]